MKNVTTELTKDHDPVWIYLIDGEYYQQKGFSTEAQAREAGENKVKELSRRRK